MYERFYNLREKPFTLLPDPGFLYLSDKHRMALTLLEYGLTSQAGFTVISGEIGAGKTTLIRHLLNKLDQEYTVGLISNTHRTFGELLQWILQAFGIDHKDMDKVGMYQRFVEFIIDEYAHNRRTVLIVDEAQNMDAETLEELRMLSNINADKDMALQVVLSGQRELRETLRRPDLAQFAQRITVDYHLEPLAEQETAGYIRHRMLVAGGDPDTFTPRACAAVHRYSGGVPRLINLLCDTALVYGYAEQQLRIGAKLVTDVAREKQQGGIFPVFEPAELSAEDAAEVLEAVAPPAPTDTTNTTDARQEHAAPAPAPAPIMDTAPHAPEAVTPAPAARPQTASAPTPATGVAKAPAGTPAETAKKKLRIAVCAVRESSRKYLSRLLESYGFDVTASLPLDAARLAALDPRHFDILLVDRENGAPALPASVSSILSGWHGTVLYNDASATLVSLQRGNPDFGADLARRIHSLVAPADAGAKRNYGSA